MAAENVSIEAGNAVLSGELWLPERSRGVVLFAHGSGSSRYSPRNQYVAQVLREEGLGTMLFDLLTREEEQFDLQTAALRFDICFLADRLMGAYHWFRERKADSGLGAGFFGSSTGGGAALVAAAKIGPEIGAVVSRGGRPDLAGPALSRVSSPTLLIVGGHDEPVIRLNQMALAVLKCEKELKIIPGATHLFEEPGALEQAARLAARWFVLHLRRTATNPNLEPNSEDRHYVS